MTPADMIVPGLWLGNRTASQDMNFLQQNNIKTVFNCTKDIPFVGAPLRFYRVPVDDNLQQEEIRNMALWSPEIVVKMMREYNSGSPMLVHCAAGMQRSAAAVAMFLICKYRCTAEEAIKYIQSRRPIAFRPAVNFYESIKTFEKTFQEHAMQLHNPQIMQKIPFPVTNQVV